MTGDVAMYVSLAVSLAVWVGIFVFLWIVERKVQDLRRRVERLTEQRNSLVPSTGSSGNRLPEHAPEPVATLERRTQEK